MSDLSWLTDEQMDRLRPFSQRATADRGLMFAAC